ncbi:MAG: hypothetical protein ACLPYS_15620 [Vulcanimicrobiaceae bacterium]|jgi:hypothetical protein
MTTMLIEFRRAAFVAATGKSIAGFDLHQLDDDPRMRDGKYMNDNSDMSR